MGTAQCIRASGAAVQVQIVVAVCRVQQRRGLQMPEGNSRQGRISLLEQARCFAVECSSAISGFRSLCGPEQRSSLSLRARHDPSFRNLSSGGCPSRDFWLQPVWLQPVFLNGATTLNRWCERNVVAPGQYSKRFFVPDAPLNRPFLAHDSAMNPAQIGSRWA